MRVLESLTFVAKKDCLPIVSRATTESKSTDERLKVNMAVGLREVLFL